MYFKRLEMHGFKSFAEPVVIEFHEGVTCIVGPNGSGKSNISDAIRWVLGEQSPKTLRGGKMEEVIFAGTASRKSRGMAEVTLVIDNSAGILNIDYNEVAITRRMYRSGESEYLINNNQCRLRDIRELIMDTGIGVDGYSLIGQGKIADIVSNKPESRREIFEEAAGIVMYKSKKAEAERKLESTGNNLDRVEDILSEIEARIDSLAEDSQKAQEYLQLKKRYQDLEINITLRNIENIVQKNKVFERDIAQLSQAIEKSENQKKEIDGTSEALKEKNDQLEHLGNKARDRLLHIVEEVNRLTSQSQINAERLSAIDREKERLSEEISTLNGKLASENANYGQLSKSKEAIQHKYQEAAEDLREKIEAHSLLTRQASELSEEADRGREELFQLHNTIASKKSEMKSYESIRDTLQKRKAQLKRDREGTQQESEDNSKLLQQAQSERETYLSVLEELRNRIDQIKNLKEQQSEKKRRMQLKAEELRLSGSQKSARKKTIEEMEHNYEGYHHAVKYIMRSGLSGIDGVVAELMEVPEGYEIAVETALGAQLQNMICQDDDAAKRAVNLLKENRAGRLTFLPLSSVRGTRAKVHPDIAQAPGYLGLAADCIRCEKAYRSVFDYLLGRVAVIEDMDTALRLSKVSGNGLRFVTLEGESINTAGAITGGRYRNKTANLLERKNEITALDREINRLEAEIKNALDSAEKAEIAVTEADSNLAKLEEQLREAELKEVALDGTIKALRDTLEQISTSDEKFSRELSSIDREAESADENAKALLSEITREEETLDRISNCIEEAMAAYEKKKLEVDLSSEAITGTRIAVTEWENKRASAENLMTRIGDSIQEYRSAIEEGQRRQSALDEEKNQILFGSDDMQDNTEKLLAEKNATELYIEQVMQERKELNDQLSSVARDQQECLRQLNGCQDQKYQLEIRLAKNETQLDTLKDRLWDDFEISYVQARELMRDDFVMSTSVKESREIRNRMRELGDVNVGAIKEYESVRQRYEFLTGQRKDIVVAMDELKGIISEMDTTIRSRFKENFDQVVDHFETTFRELFGGGHAELRMEDESNPLESGIDIVAQPPGKKLQNINLMSGGEKTMTAIALMFAVLKTKPTPFCILDEVEAALDDANIDRFAKYLRHFDNIQFTLITHQKATMEHADVLYGVTMPEQGVSKVLSLQLGDDFEL